VRFYVKLRESNFINLVVKMFDKKYWIIAALVILNSIIVFDDDQKNIELDCSLNDARI